MWAYEQRLVKDSSDVILYRVRTTDSFTDLGIDMDSDQTSLSSLTVPRSAASATVAIVAAASRLAGSVGPRASTTPSLARRQDAPPRTTGIDYIFQGGQLLPSVQRC